MIAPRSLTRALLQQGARALAARDADLARIHRRLGDPPIWGRRPGFPALVKIILEQQVSLRSAAATLRELEGHARLSPRESLAQVVSDLGDARFTQVVEQMSVARERGVLPPGAPRQAVLALIDLAGAMHERALRLRTGPA